MHCNESRNYFADYLAEDLNPSTQEDFAGHLKECPECRAELGMLTDLWVKLGSVPAGEPASADLDVRLRASAEAYGREVQDAGKSRRVWKRVLLVAGIAAAIAVAVVVPARMLQHAPAVLEGMASSQNIEFGEAVHSGNASGRTLVLADSSRVEMRARTELLLERGIDGVSIRLGKGGILVTAAKQQNGHLYVQTKDLSVSVVGTVFLVNAEEEGSRVAVIEGEVRVKHGETERRLRKGEQVATNPKMEPQFFSKELEWSPDAETQLAALQQAAAPAPVAPAEPTRAQERFEVASIRFKPTGNGGRGVPANANTCQLPRIQIDPRRLSIPGASLNTLIVLAYPEWAGRRGGCSAVSAGGILSGGQGWVRSDLWDIQATIPEGPVDYKVTTRESPPGARRGNPPPPIVLVEDLGPRVRGMLQNLLADRFQLVLRSQTKDMPVYLLTVGKDGFKSNGNPIFAMANGQVARINGAAFGSEKMVMRRGITEVDGQNVLLPRDIPAGATPKRYMSLGIWKMSMPEVAMSLIEITERPVLDRTNLAGTFDFHIDYDSDGSGARPSIFKAIEEVGLKLESARAPIEVWNIEGAERPSEN
jgi:uncharacterized protein (TIGR03435 family)